MNISSIDSKSIQDFSQDISNKDFIEVSPSNDSGLTNDISICDITLQFNKNSPNPSQSNNEVNNLNESILLQQTEVSNEFVNYITNTIDNTLNPMDNSNVDRRKVTVSEPTDKLSQDIQIKAEEILTDLRSLPLNYSIKRKGIPNTKNLGSTALKNKNEDDEIGDTEDDDITVALSDGHDDDSNDEYKGTSDKPFPQLLTDNNQLKSLDRTIYKNFENIRQKSNLLKIRCDMLQTYIHFLEARKRSLEHSITELNQHYERNQQQLENKSKQNECKIDSQQFEEILTNQSIALVKEKEQTAQFRLKYESVEAARFELSQQLQLISSEYDADKRFYQKQIRQLEEEIQERINKTNEIKYINEQLQNEILNFKNQINSLKEKLKQNENEVNVISQCYDQKIKEESEQHELEIVKLQREITDLSDKTSKASTKYEYEIDTLNTHLRISQNKIHDLLCEKEHLCKQLQDITHKLNISSQEKEELQKKMDNELLRTKQEKESEFMEIQTNLKDQKKKLNEIQLKYDTDIGTLKKNHEVEIEKLKIDLKGNESLNKQLMCHINTLENCIYNSTQQKHFCDQQIQTDICLKPIGSNEESQKSNDLKDISIEPKLPSTIFPIINMNNSNPNLKYLTTVNKSTETSPAQLDSIMNDKNVQLSKPKDYQQLIDNYENKLSQLHLCLHQLYHDYDTLIHLFNNTIYGIIKFGNQECNRFSKLLNISNQDIEIPSSLLHSKLFHPLKTFNKNGRISNLTENTIIIKSWINPLIDVIGKLSAYCIRICDLIESQQDHLEWQSKNVNELRDITRKQIEIQNKQLIKTRKANLNRLRSCLKQNQYNSSLNEVNSSLSKDNSDSFPIVYNNGNSDKIILPNKDIGSKFNYNMSTLKNPIYPPKSIDSNLYFNDSMNKLIGTQHQSYSPVSRVKGSFDKSPPPRLLHTNITNMSPYENMKYFNNSENSFNEDGQFYSPNLL
uniref:Uncharacterized protein n=1 Tax=Schistosoma mansoni TaxID=6183 RepID=A0A5K4F541_SCHMA